MSKKRENSSSKNLPRNIEHVYLVEVNDTAENIFSPQGTLKDFKV
jgi:hypothetical protein